MYAQLIGEGSRLMKSIIQTIATEELAGIVNQSTSKIEVMSKLGYKGRSGGVSNMLTTRLDADGIDYSHFTTKVAKPLEEVMVENSTFNTQTLKERIIAEGIIPYVCSCCGNDGTWMGNPLTLQLDHINGVNNDHRKENLRFLCPNCHSQTTTFGGRNIRKSVAKAV